MHHHDKECGWGSRGEFRFGRRGGFGAFGRGFGPFGPGGRGGPEGGGQGGGGMRGLFRAGKMLADGDLKLIALALIAEEPRHGYDIIKALEERTSRIYSPSPGVVYPTLTFLEEAGFATSAAEGAKKVYSITEAGRAHLEENRELVDGVLAQMKSFGEKMARARDWFERSERRGGDERDERGDRDMPGVLPELNEARRTLKAALAALIDAPEAAQHRGVDILNEAAAALRAALADADRKDADI